MLRRRGNGDTACSVGCRYVIPTAAIACFVFAPGAAGSLRRLFCRAMLPGVDPPIALRVRQIFSEQSEVPLEQVYLEMSITNDLSS